MVGLVVIIPGSITGHGFGSLEKQARSSHPRICVVVKAWKATIDEKMASRRFVTYFLRETANLIVL